MAIPADKSYRGLGRPGLDQEADLRDEFNKLVTQFRALCTKLDSNHGAASDHAATLSAADSASPAKIVPA